GSLDTTRTRIGLVVEGDSAAALGLAEAYTRSPLFDVTPSRTLAPLRDRMIEGQVRAIVVIPQAFGDGIARRSPPAVQIITDGSQPNTAALVAAYAEGVRQSW